MSFFAHHFTKPKETNFIHAQTEREKDAVTFLLKNQSWPKYDSEEYVFYWKGEKRFIQVRSCESKHCDRKRDDFHLVFLFHGLGSCLDRQAPTVNYMYEHTNCVMLGYDQLGHGHSVPGFDKRLMHLPESSDEMLHVMHEVILKHRKEEDYPKTFLWGSSMGGGLILQYLQKYEETFDGIMLIAPMIRLYNPPHPRLQSFVRLVANYAPYAPIRPRKISYNTRIAEIHEKSEADERCWNRSLSAVSVRTILSISSYVEKNLPSLNVPCIIFHGIKDETVDYSGSEKLYDQNQSKDKVFITFTEGRHSLQQDYCSLDLMQYMVDWVQTRVKNPSIRRQQKVVIDG